MAFINSLANITPKSHDFLHIIGISHSVNEENVSIVYNYYSSIISKNVVLYFTLNSTCIYIIIFIKKQFLKQKKSGTLTKS